MNKQKTKKIIILCVLGVIFIALGGLFAVKTFKKEVNSNKEPAKYKLADQVGENGVEIDYASDELLIFHGSFGLFIYNLQEQSMVNSINLKKIGCEKMQGEHCCEVTVNDRGNAIIIHLKGDQMTYLYGIEKDVLGKVEYSQVKHPFQGKVDNPESSDTTSQSAVQFDNGEIGYLSFEDQTIGGIQYIRGEKTYHIFN